VAAASAVGLLQVKAHVYVEIGRVVVINYGEQSGKLAVIIDVVDQARVSCGDGGKAANAAPQPLAVPSLTRALTLVNARCASASCIIIIIDVM
jgi:ribosomal protein L14E/L6E/L27E